MNKPLVYFVQCNEFVKIGRSTQLPLTLRSLQRGNPYGLEVVAVISCESTERMSELEADLHRQFKEHRIRGEWFFLCPKIETYIKTHGQDPMPYLDDTEYLERKRRYNADPEYRKKQRKYYSAYKKRRYQEDPEYREKQNRYSREYRRKRMQDPEYREKERERERKRKRKPEYLEKQREYNRKRMQDPEYREKERERKRQYDQKRRKHRQKKAKSSENQLTLFDEST